MVSVPKKSSNAGRPKGKKSSKAGSEAKTGTEAKAGAEA